MQSVPKNETFKEHRANSESQGPGLALNFQLKCKLVKKKKRKKKQTRAPTVRGIGLGEC